MDTQENFVSPLGSKDYWDDFYRQEIDQHSNNPEMIGEVWFGKQVQQKEVAYVIENIVRKGVKTLDLGCGNAAFLLALAKRNFTNLFGMDYSENSIRLARKVIRNKSLKHPNCSSINLFWEDINSPDDDFGEFELIHDKGTFDAYLLNKDNKAENYVAYLLCKSADKCVFVITSCNHTRDELIGYLAENNPLINLVTEIPHKKFSFGGQTGQSVTSLVFQIEK